MKSSYIFGAAMAASSLVSLVKHADAATVTAAAFTFESTLSSTFSATGTTYSVVADSGTGTMTVNHFGGSSVYTSPSGNGSARGFASTGWTPPDSYVFSVSTAGLTNIQVSFDTTSDATGPEDFGIGIEKAGSYYTTIAGSDATFPSSTGFSLSSNPAFTFSYDFSNFTKLNNTSILIRLQDVDSTDTGGTNEIDNFVVSGVSSAPEPASLTLLGLAVTAVGGLGRRRSRV